jgi:molybdenum cofactor biosynthesis enzyme MoaA
VAARLRTLPGVRYLGLTTNGLGLARLPPALQHAGVDGVKISLDLLWPET